MADQTAEMFGYSPVTSKRGEMFQTVPRKRTAMGQSKNYRNSAPETIETRLKKPALVFLVEFETFPLMTQNWGARIEMTVVVAQATIVFHPWMLVVATGAAAESTSAMLVPGAQLILVLNTGAP